MPIDPIPFGFFSGGAKLTPSEGESLRSVLNEVISLANALEGTPDLNESVKVSLADAVTGFLEDKLQAGSGIAFNVVDIGGGNLRIEISAPGSSTDIAVQVTPGDTTPSGLQAKLVDKDGNSFFVKPDTVGGDEKLQLPIGAGSGAGGWIYIEDVSVPGGSAGTKTFQDAGATVLQSVTVSDASIEVAVRSGFPLVQVDGTPATLARDVSGGFFSGTVPITIAGTGDIVAVSIGPDGDPTAEDTVAVTLESPPTLTQANFAGPYPTGPGGLQSELKEDDSFDLQVAADKSFDLVEILAFGASKFVSVPVAPTVGPVTVQIAAEDQGDVAQLLSAQVRVRDSVTGAFSAARDTNVGGGGVDGVDVVNLNNLRPTGSIGSIDYPVPQAALKGVEQATVNHTANDFDSIQYVDPTGTQITIANDTTFEAAKQVTSQNPGVFNDATQNFRYTLTRNANGSQATVSGVVVIADTPAVVTIGLPAARLRSGGNDGTAAQDHSVVVQSSQPLLSAPSLAADSGGNRGVFQGGGFTGGPSNWSRDLRVDETVPTEKGVFSFENLSATNLANTETTVISGSADYDLGGFVPRQKVVPAFASTVQIGVEVVDFTKLQAGAFSPGGASVKQPIGTTADVVNGYTIDAVGVNPTTIKLLDDDAVAANSLGLYNLSDIEEVV